MFQLFKHHPVISFYKPNADAVSLAIEGFDKPLPMSLTADGNWEIKLPQHYKNLHGREYHFEVHQNNITVQLADPLAYRTERLEKKLISRFSDLNYRWQQQRFTPPPLSEIVIYETHLPALTRHSSAKVINEDHRGTYIGACSPAVLDHLENLNVAVEFLPLHASDKDLGQDWGYFSTSFRAMRESYAHKSDEINREVMALIDAMHCRGIPVILDVVFNHGGELLVKAWGQDIVYRKHDNGDFCHGSGCGPTVGTEHPFIRETIIQTLEHLVKDYRFDGFRFDLGALHDKQTILEIDRRLPAHIYLISEPWALGGTQWGKGDLNGDLANTRWAVWNDDFREPGKTLLLGMGDQHNRSRLMLGIKGSLKADGGWAQRSQQSINYLSSHDGNTLTDFVAGDKHRVFLGILLVLTSQGVPMIGEGSEMMYSKKGDINSYNRSDLNQIDWENAQIHHDLVDAVAKLIALRKQMPHFSYTRQLIEFDEKVPDWDIDWIYPTGYPHKDNVNAIGYCLRPPSGNLVERDSRSLIILLNGSKTGTNFNLPKGMWKVLVDGRQIAVNAQGLPDAPLAKQHYFLHSGTGVILTPVQCID